MKNKPIILLAQLMIWLLFQGTVAAQSFTAQQEARIAYYRRYVTPAINQQRLRLEKALSVEDKQLLASARSKMRDIYRRGLPLQTPMPDGSLPRLSEEQQQQLSTLHSEHQAAMASLAQLIEKHQVLLTAIAQQLQPQKEKWLVELEKIQLMDKSPKTGVRSREMSDRSILETSTSPGPFLMQELPASLKKQAANSIK